MKDLIIVVDMDEVTADLSNTIRKRVNKDFGKDFPEGYNKSYWWKDYCIQKSYFEHLLNEKGFFASLKPISGAIETLDKLNQEGYEIHILTCPQSNRYCYFEKIMWVQKYLPFVNIETNFHATGNKGLFAKENRILIDDNIKYLNQWSNNGGISIAFGKYGWNEDYDGINAANWNEVYNKIKELEALYNCWIEPKKNEKSTDFNVNISCKSSDINIDLDKYRNYIRREID